MNMAKRLIPLLILILIIGMVGFTNAQEEVVNEPIPLSEVSMSEIFPKIGLYVWDGNVYRVDFTPGHESVEVQTGENNWLTIVEITDVYFINKYYLAFEGRKGDTDWLFLSALDDEGNVGFGRWVKKFAYDAFYVDPEHFGYTSADGQRCVLNIHGRLFGEPVCE